MVDKEEAMQRIMDMYDYYGFLRLVFDYDSMADEIIELTGVEDDEAFDTEE